MKARIALLAALLLAPAVPTAQAQLVTRPIVFVVPYSPGGNVDVSARILQAGIGDALGQPIIVENKPGAGGMLAGDYVARAEPDGQTLFVGSNGPLVLGPMAMPNAPYQWGRCSHRSRHSPSPPMCSWSIRNCQSSRSPNWSPMPRPIPAS